MTVSEYLSACIVMPIADVPLDDAMTRWMNQLIMARDHQGVVHLVGNGGSASVAAHAQNDLVKACGLRALCYQDVPLLTAFANDHGYENGYSDALSIWLNPQDVLIAISSSGASPNILNAVRLAKTIRVAVVTCSGFSPNNALRELGDLNFYVPSDDYGQVELTHAALLHCLTDRMAAHA